MKSQALELINCWSWFDYVPAEAKDWLADRCRIMTVDKGTTLYRHGDPVTHIYGVASGGFRIFVASAAGDEMTLEEVAAGAWFPHFLPSDHPTYFCHCVCVKQATIIALSTADFLTFGSRWPEFYRGLYTEFVARGAVTIGRMELLTLHTLHVRMAVYLLRMLVIQGRERSSGVFFIESEVSQSEIANRVGGARQRVNSILKEWERLSAIEMARSGIVIRDTKFLSGIVRDSGFDLDAYLGAWQGGWKSPFQDDSGFLL